MSRNVQKGLDQELECLQLIGRFGWLRLQEIAQFLWFYEKNINSYQYSQNLVKKLLDKNLKPFARNFYANIGMMGFLPEKVKALFKKTP